MTVKPSANGVASVPFEERVLLLPHCLRPSDVCKGKMTKQGLDCTGCTLTDCAIYQLRQVAQEAGYGGVCVAPGGKLAVRYLAKNQPHGVVAIACAMELEEGLDAIDSMEWPEEKPAVAVLPLLEDGCVDTVVDVDAARKLILTRNGHHE